MAHASPIPAKQKVQNFLHKTHDLIAKTAGYIRGQVVEEDEDKEANCNECSHFSNNLPDAEFAALRMQYGLPLNYCLSDYHKTEDPSDLQDNGNLISENNIEIGSCSDYPNKT